MRLNKCVINNTNITLMLKIYFFLHGGKTGDFWITSCILFPPKLIFRGQLSDFEKLVFANLKPL